MRMIKNINTYDNHSLRNNASRAVLVIITTAIIVWFMPRTSGMSYHYDVGKPWSYKSLIADFDFPVYKSEELLQYEQDSILANYEPYYEYNSNVEKTQIAKFINEYKDGIPGLGQEYVRIICTQLHKIYQAGVIAANDYSRVHKDSTSMIRVINGKIATNISTSGIYTPLSGYEQIFSDPRLEAQRQALQKCNLNEFIHSNLKYDKERNKTEQEDLLSSIPIANGMVLSGQKIIDRGDIVDEQLYRVLSSFEKESQRRKSNTEEISSILIGQIFYVTLLILVFTTFIALFRRDYFGKPRALMMVYVMLTIFPIIVSLMVENQFLSVYMIPFAIAPIFIRVFMDSRTAVMAHAAVVLICASILQRPLEFIAVQLAAGLTAVFSLRELSSRSQLFWTAIVTTMMAMLTNLSIFLIRHNDFSSIDGGEYVFLAISGIVLFCSYPMLYLIEKFFGFISDITLIELSDMNKVLLRRMSEVAPGTFQHSIQVGNLAAEIARKIGGNPQLVRTGALYHDIGKMQNPIYFTENQSGGISPHSQLTYIESAQMIISHVTEGLKLADENNLPVQIRDLIATHHGQGKAKYFYIKYKNEFPDQPVDDLLFTYPGPNPFTKEQAILMMADAVEAASRSLPDYTEQTIRQLVNKLIDGMVDDGFFHECPITFRDIQYAKTVLIEKLKTIYHTRISYPEMKK